MKLFVQITVGANHATSLEVFLRLCGSKQTTPTPSKATSPSSS